MKKLFIAFLMLTAGGAYASEFGDFPLQDMQSAAPAEDIAVPASREIVGLTGAKGGNHAVIDTTMPKPVEAPLYNGNFSEYEEYQKPAVLVASDGGSYTVAGIRTATLPENKDLYSWDTVKIIPEMVEEAYWGYESGGVGHSFIVLAFKPGGMTARDGRDLTSLVVSAEAWYRKGEDYKPLTWGVQDHYPIIWVLSNWEHFVELDLSDKRNLYLSPFNISREEKVDLARIAVREGVKNRAGEYYNTFKNSCTNMPMDLLGEAISKDFRFFNTIPLAGLAHLKTQGYIGETVKITTKNIAGFHIRPSDR